MLQTLLARGRRSSGSVADEQQLPPLKAPLGLYRSSRFFEKIAAQCSAYELSQSLMANIGRSKTATKNGGLFQILGITRRETNSLPIGNNAA